MMAVIFLISSRAGDELLNFLSWDFVIKKSGHAIGYGLLALSYLYLMEKSQRRYWLAWLMALAFSATDEFHQSFVPGRHASVYDVIVFDNIGAAIALLLHSRFKSRSSE
jgi:VanZ family protein